MLLNQLQEDIRDSYSPKDSRSPIEQALELVEKAGLAGARNLVVPQARAMLGNTTILKGIGKAKTVWKHIHDKVKHHKNFKELDQAMQQLGNDQYRDAELYTD